MKRRDYSKYSKIALTFASLLALAGIISFIAILVLESSHKISVSSNGFSEFFKLFNGPLSLLAASFAVFATWLTLERIAQTESQLDLIGENNKFNNYYKHIEEFTKQFKDDRLIQRWKNLTRGDPHKELLSLYGDFYYRHPLDFAPRMNSDAKALIDQFLRNLKTAAVNREGFTIESCNEGDLASLSNDVPSSLGRIITSINARESPSVRARLTERSTSQRNQADLLVKFINLNKVYWSHMFFLSLLAFDGHEQPELSQVSANYDFARITLGI